MRANGFRQLFRTPTKVLLFFLLLAAGTALVTIGAILFTQTSDRISQVESEFVTIGTVEQKPVTTLAEERWNECLQSHGNIMDAYDDLVSVEALNFPGAEYIGEPESRPIYFSTWMKHSLLRSWNAIRQEFVITFTPLSDNDGTGPVEAEVVRVWYSNVQEMFFSPPPDNLEVGEIIPICQHFSETPVRLEKGRTYIASLVWRSCSFHSGEYPNGEYVVYQMPHSTQYDAAGNLLPGKETPTVASLYQEGDALVFRAGATQSFPALNDPSIGVQEIKIDPDNAADQLLPVENGWLSWLQALRMQYNRSFVLPTNDLNLLPSFHSGKAVITEGRAITEEEFQTGARVCLIPHEMVSDPHLGFYVGQEINLPLYCSLYNYDCEKQVNSFRNYRSAPFQRRYSLLNADGVPYSPFSNDVYTIVGTYTIDDFYHESGDTEIPVDCAIIPAKSVTVSDANNIAYYAPMNAKSTSFRIPNGSIERFDAAFHAAVPEAEKLTIAYEDHGYTEVMGDLQRTKVSALLLLFAGIGASIAIVLLLLYFFIIKQEKQTAIERSLGLTKGQCRRSLLSGIMALAFFAVCAGSALGTYAVTKMEGTTQEVEFDLSYSDWSEAAVEPPAGDGSANVPYLSIFVPLGLWVFILIMGLLAMEHNLKIEPIYLLGRKTE